MIRECVLSGAGARRLHQSTEFDSVKGWQAMARRVTDSHQRGEFPQALTVPVAIRSCYLRDVYFNPEKVMLLTDPLYWDKLPPEELERDVYTIAFPSQSERAMVLIWDDGSVSEFKGETLPPEYLRTAGIHDQSREPVGFLTRAEGEREAELINFVGALDSRWHLLGEGENCRGQVTQYGQLVREGRDFFPWIRLDRPFDHLLSLSQWEGVSLESYIGLMGRKLGAQLKKLHSNNYYNVGYRRGHGFKGILSFCHIGNIEAHGNLLDLAFKNGEETIRLFEEKESHGRSVEERYLFSAFLDIHRIFGGIYLTRDSFIWGADEGLVSREWDPVFFDLFLKSFAGAYFGDDPKATDKFAANWRAPDKLMPLLARQY